MIKNLDFFALFFILTQKRRSKAIFFRDLTPIGNCI